MSFTSRDVSSKPFVANCHNLREISFMKFFCDYNHKNGVRVKCIKVGPDSKLQISSVCSIRSRSRKFDIFENPLQRNPSQPVKSILGLYGYSGSSSIPSTKIQTTGVTRGKSSFDAGSSWSPGKFVFFA